MIARYRITLLLALLFIIALLTPTFAQRRRSRPSPSPSSSSSSNSNRNPFSTQNKTNPFAYSYQSNLRTMSFQDEPLFMQRIMVHMAFEQVLTNHDVDHRALVDLADSQHLLPREDANRLARVMAATEYNEYCETVIQGKSTLAYRETNHLTGQQKELVESYLAAAEVVRSKNEIMAALRQKPSNFEKAIRLADVELQKDLIKARDLSVIQSILNPASGRWNEEAISESLRNLRLMDAEVANATALRVSVKGFVEGHSYEGDNQLPKNVSPEMAKAFQRELKALLLQEVPQGKADAQPPAVARQKVIPAGLHPLIPVELRGSKSDADVRAVNILPSLHLVELNGYAEGIRNQAESAVLDRLQDASNALDQVARKAQADVDTMNKYLESYHDAVASLHHPVRLTDLDKGEIDGAALMGVPPDQGIPRYPVQHFHNRLGAASGAWVNVRQVGTIGCLPWAPREMVRFAVRKAVGQTDLKSESIVREVSRMFPCTAPTSEEIAIALVDVIVELSHARNVPPSPRDKDNELLDEGFVTYPQLDAKALARAPILGVVEFGPSGYEWLDSVVKRSSRTQRVDAATITAVNALIPLVDKMPQRTRALNKALKKLDEIPNGSAEVKHALDGLRR